MAAANPFRNPFDRMRFMRALLGAWARIGLDGRGRILVEPKHGPPLAGADS